MQETPTSNAQSIRSMLVLPLTTFQGCVAFLVGFGFLFEVYSDCVNRQWDFPVYYLAGRAIEQHSNPYDPAVLQGISNEIDEVGYGGGLPFLYPPHAARMIYPLSQLPFFTASFLWLVLKCIALEGMIFITIRLLHIPVHILGLLLLHLGAAYFRPIWLDLNAGNIATFEITLILLGLYLWSNQKKGWGGFFVTSALSLKGLFLFFLYPLYWRDWKFLKAALWTATGIGLAILLDGEELGQFIAYFRGEEWARVWDEQVQSFYNCSYVTVLLRTFSDTYFAEPLVRMPVLSTILIPVFANTIFLLMVFSIHHRSKKMKCDQFDGMVLSVFLCGIILLPPRLAGYTLVWLFYPVAQVIHACWRQKRIIPCVPALLGILLIQLNLPPNHIPSGGILQLFIDKDFFGLLFIFGSTCWLCCFPPSSKTFPEKTNLFLQAALKSALWKNRPQG